MPNKFRVTDAKGKKYTIERLAPITNHHYSIKTTKGQYAEIIFDEDKWTEKWNNSFVAKFDYDLSEIGRLIQEHYDFNRLALRSTPLTKP